MRVIPGISLLSVLLTIMFAAATVWGAPAAAATDVSKQTAVKKAGPKAHNKVKKSTRARRIRFPVQTRTAFRNFRAPVAPYTAATMTPPAWTCSPTWGVPATSGGIAPQTVGQGPPPPPQPPGPVCQNPCTTCWTLPQQTWAAPATWGGVAPRATAGAAVVPPPPPPVPTPRPVAGGAQRPPDQVTVCCNSGPTGTNPVSWSTWCY